MIYPDDSIMGALRTWPEFLYTIFNHGFYHSVCIPSFYDGVTGFWAYMFVIRYRPQIPRLNVDPLPLSIYFIPGFLSQLFTQ